jgi:hypothetical protein
MKYNIDILKKELIEKIAAFLKGNLNDNDLITFAWEQIYKWENIDDSTLPPYTNDDTIYWHAIHDLIHLNEESIEFHTSKKDIEKHLNYLKGKDKLPENVFAARPSKGFENTDIYNKNAHKFQKKSYLP